MKSWWSLGEGIGQLGVGLALYQIECPFCNEKGNFKIAYHAEKKKPNSSKKINFDTYQCGSCAGYVQVLWSASEFSGSRGLHSFRVQPWPVGKPEPSEKWPKTIGRFWVQAHENETNENWDAATVMARSALQAALRNQQAEGGNLKEEIDDLLQKGILPKIMKEWSDEIRLLGNESAHPNDSSQPPSEKDVRDVINFLDYLLMYLFDLPSQIQEFRERKLKKGKTSN